MQAALARPLSGRCSGRDYVGGIEVALEGYQISRSNLSGQ